MKNITKALVLSQICATVSAAATSLRRSLNEDTRVIGGTNAEDGRYNYAVSLQDSYGHYCGGSLIAPNVVLSAAHCRQQYSSNIKVVIGRHDLRDTDVGEEIRVKGQYPHPNYNAQQTDNDLMLILLESDSTEGTIVNVNPDFIGGNQAVTTMGYGDTDPSSASRLAPILQHTEVYTVSKAECEASSGTIGGFEIFGMSFGGQTGSYSNMISDNMLCAADAGEDSCQGDSGGPLVIRSEDGNDTQVAGKSAKYTNKSYYHLSFIITNRDNAHLPVVSWGYGCAHPEFPGVYAQLSSQYKWIKDNVCTTDNPPSSFDCDGTGTYTQTQSTTPATTTTSPPLATSTTPVTTQAVNDILNFDGLESNGGYVSILEDNFYDEFGIFSIQNKATHYVSALEGDKKRAGVVRVHGGSGGKSEVKTNELSLDGSPFNEYKVSISTYVATTLDPSDNLCLKYSLGGTITGEKCWGGSYFTERKWYEDMSIHFKAPDADNLVISISVEGDEADEEVLIDYIKIQGKTSDMTHRNHVDASKDMKALDSDTSSSNSRLGLILPSVLVIAASSLLV